MRLAEIEKNVGERDEGPHDVGRFLRNIVVNVAEFLRQLREFVT